MGSLSDFAKSMRSKAAKAEPEIAKGVAKLAIQIVTDVAYATPIKTGQAQSNWLTSIGVPNPFYKANEGMNRAWTESVADATAVLANYKGDRDIHITNNVPYISDLNNGSSRQAPALFVQAAVLRAQYTFKSLKINL